jgi:hypothetical protein
MASLTFTGVMGAAGAAVNPVAKADNQWTTTTFDCGPKAPKDHWALAMFCGPCVAAQAKAQMDKSNPVFNFFCFTPLGSYNQVRHSYGIKGTCGDDLLNACLCMPCGARQIYTESSLVGQVPGTYGQDSGQWIVNLMTCEPNSCMKATFCPCIISHSIRSLLLPHTKEDPYFNYLCILPMSMYGQTRHHVGIKSEWPHPTCEDVAVGCFFYPCALLRAEKEALAWRTKQTANSVVAGAMGAAVAKVGNLKNAAAEKLSGKWNKGGGMH